MASCETAKLSFPSIDGVLLVRVNTLKKRIIATYDSSDEEMHVRLDRFDNGRGCAISSSYPLLAASLEEIEEIVAGKRNIEQHDYQRVFSDEEYEGQNLHFLMKDNPLVLLSQMDEKTGLIRTSIVTKLVEGNSTRKSGEVFCSAIMPTFSEGYRLLNSLYVPVSAMDSFLLGADVSTLSAEVRWGPESTHE